MVTRHLPSYADLRNRADGPPGSTWGMFSTDPQRGMANLAGPAQVRQAAGCVLSGEVFNLDYPLDAFVPPLFPERHPYRHEIFPIGQTVLDDYVDQLYLQGSSQVDGLRHIRDYRFGHYNAVPAQALVTGTSDLGIQLWAEKPIVGRALLIDLAGTRQEEARPLDHAAGEAIEFATVSRALARQGQQVQPGDIVLLHTGWSAWYLEQPEESRATVRERAVYTGMYPDPALLAWLWDSQVAFLGSDTVSVEVYPAPPDPPLLADSPENKGRLHGQLIARLGLMLGELWKLDELTTHSRATGRWDALITIKPLNLTGAVGSPPNAVAVR
jgi:kynurenine formamidase